MRLNKYQIRSLKRLFDRLKPPISFLNFRRECYPEIGCKDTAIIEYNGITYGIEPDGYCHT